MSRKKIKVIAVTPLDPPATEAEKNEASRVWTAAMDVMESRGFGRYLWGNTSEAAHDFVILMLRAARSGNGMPHDEAEARCQAVTGNREGQVPTSAAVEQSEPRPEAAPGGDEGKKEPLSQPCASCPFLRDNHKEFGVVAEKLCAKFGRPKPDFWACLSIRESVKSDAIKSRRLQCHRTVYDAEMNAHPESSRPCAGLAAHLRAMTK